MKTIEIPTADGVLPVPTRIVRSGPNNPIKGSEYFQQHINGSWAFNPHGGTCYGKGTVWAVEDWGKHRVLIAAVAAELWKREADRWCEYGVEMHNPDRARNEHFCEDCYDAARAWGKKGETHGDHQNPDR